VGTSSSYSSSSSRTVVRLERVRFRDPNNTKPCYSMAPHQTCSRALGRAENEQATLRNWLDKKTVPWKIGITISPQDERRQSRLLPAEADVRPTVRLVSVRHYQRSLTARTKGSFQPAAGFRAKSFSDNRIERVSAVARRRLTRRNGRLGDLRREIYP
jgi:hypothetical protein